MVFTPIAGLGGRVVVPRAGRATSTRRTSSLSASRGGNGSNGGNGLRRTGGSGEGGDSGKARLALSGASLALSLVAALPAAAAPKKGKMVLPELTHFDLAVRARFLVPGAVWLVQFWVLTPLTCWNNHLRRSTCPPPPPCLQASATAARCW